MPAGANREADILQQIKVILRRDLKLGPDAPIPDDMPFFGGDIDLDSLDILLLVTSIEREFGFKIPNEAVGKTVFENVSTLARFIGEHVGAGAPASAATTTKSPIDYLARLPHGEPFRFINRIIELNEGKSATGVWSIRGDESFFAGHFPGNPVVPGVLIVEALAQLSGLAGPVTEGDPMAPRQGKLAHIDVRFDSSVVPPADLVLKSSLTRVMGSLQQFDVSATLGDTIVARGSITLHRTSADARVKAQAT